MSFETFYEDLGFPMKGSKLQKLKDFLNKQQLSYEEEIEYTINLCDNKGDIIATGSVEKNVLKCIAVSDLYKGEGLSAKIVSALISYGVSKGHDHLFLFTKTENISIFEDLGFYLIANTKYSALMENKRNGISEYINTLKSNDFHTNDDVGAIVMNCNPFTDGHLYLVEKASEQCSCLHLFVVSENRSVFPSDVRYKLVKEGVKHLKNVLVHPTSDYMISSATFPTYFIKDKYKAGEINCILDLTIFCEYFAKFLCINKRFVGTEPYDNVTSAYNVKMKEILSKYNIDVIEIPRLEKNNTPISASRVRKLMTEKNYEEIRKIVPETTYNYILSDEGIKIAQKIRSSNV